MYQPNFSRYDFTLCFASYKIYNVMALKKPVQLSCITGRSCGIHYIGKRRLFTMVNIATSTLQCHLLVTKFNDEQYATINQSSAGRFNLRVFVNCLQIEKCCERRLIIWLQSGDITNACANKVNTYD